jgi:hypothetical protein
MRMKMLANSGSGRMSLSGKCYHLQSTLSGRTKSVSIRATKRIGAGRI